MSTDRDLLAVEHLKQYFPVAGRRGKFVHAVDDVSFTIQADETFGLVGESGCGKSTLARAVIRINQPTEGRVLFEGVDISRLSQRELKQQQVRRKMQMVFQDPYSSLNSQMTVRNILLEPLIANQVGDSDAQRVELAQEALNRVGLAPSCIDRYPHEFSGGQRQRICIARALIVQPKMVICDEAISALDVSVQAQVVNLLGDFQRELGLTYLFIAHDLSMVRYVSHRVGVMYLGRLVELCESEEIYQKPLHPYTQGLLRSVPIANPRLARSRSQEGMEGEVPSPIDPPAGCHFHPRCPHAKPICREVVPGMHDAGGGHMVRCHLFDA